MTECLEKPILEEKKRFWGFYISIELNLNKGL